MRVRHAFKVAVYVFVPAVSAAPSHAAPFASAIAATSAHLEAASFTAASSPVLCVSFVASGSCRAVVLLAVLAVGICLLVSFAVVFDIASGPVVLKGAAGEAVTAATFVAANVGWHILGGREVLEVVLVVRLHVEVVPVGMLLRLLVATSAVPASALRSVLAAAIVVLARIWHLLVVVSVLYLLHLGLVCPVAFALGSRMVAAMVVVRMGVLGILLNVA